MRNFPDGHRDLEELEKRRFRAIDLLQQGESKAAVARRFGVSSQTVARWESQFRLHGRAGLKRADQSGRKPKLDQNDRERLQKLLLQGPKVIGYETGQWTCPRVANLIERKFGVRYHTGHVWKLLTALGWAVKRPTGQALYHKKAKTLRWERCE